MIHSCSVMDPEQGYLYAPKLLKERFGDNYVISEAWINKICNGRVIRPNDGKVLREISDDLRNCEATLIAMKCLSEINTQRILTKIVAILEIEVN